MSWRQTDRQTDGRTEGHNSDVGISRESADARYKRQRYIVVYVIRTLFGR